MGLFRKKQKKRNDKEGKKKSSNEKSKRFGKAEKIIPQVKQIEEKDGVNPDKDGDTHALGSGNGIKKLIRIALRSFKGFLSITSPNKKPTVRDPGKKQRALLLALVIVGAVFGLKIWRPETWELDRAILVAAAAGALSFLGLIWVMRFNISNRALLRVLPQASIFVFGAILFLILFFFGEFERIYESLIFIIFLLGFVVLLTMVFLTANILSVAAVKKIPLFRVGQTASYAITLFAAFFVTASFVSSGLDLLILLPILVIIYGLLIGLHLSHFPVRDEYLLWYAISIAWASIMVLMALLVWPVSGLLISFAPVTIIYSGLGMVMYHIEGLEKARMRQIIFEFLFINLISLIVIVLQAQWGIGGAFWM